MLVGCGYKDESNIDSTNVLVANLKPLYWACSSLQPHPISTALFPYLFASYAMLMRRKMAETAAYKIQPWQLARSGVSPSVVLHRNSCQWLLAIISQFNRGGKAHYERGHSAQYSGFKLAKKVCAIYHTTNWRKK